MAVQNVIEYLTLSTLSNATDFGDLTEARYGPAGASSNVKGIFGGGVTGTIVNTSISYSLGFLTIVHTALPII